MIAVLDTNVFLGAFLSPRGAPAQILRRWEAEEFELATSPALRAELGRALEHPKVKKTLKTSDEEIQKMLYALEKKQRN